MKPSNEHTISPINDRHSDRHRSAHLTGGRLTSRHTGEPYIFSVLIVDDNPITADLNRLFISRVTDLHCYGATATIGDVKAVLNHLAQVDLLLLDAYMRQESGLGLLPALHVDGRNIDTTMMTSAVGTLALQAVLHYGMVDYLIKPF